MDVVYVITRSLCLGPTRLRHTVHGKRRRENYTLDTLVDLGKDETEGSGRSGVDGKIKTSQSGSLNAFIC